MKVRMVNVIEEDWNFFIVLDAYRYNYFLETYKSFFTGKQGVELWNVHSE